MQRNLRHLQLLEVRARYTLNIMEKRFGVECEVFFPLKKDTTYQEADDSIPVSSTPNYKGVLIIPQIYQKGAQGTMDMLDSFDVDPTLYLPQQLDFPRNSVIKPLLQIEGAMDRNILYRIDSFVSMSPRPWYRKALLVPAGRRVEVPQEIEMLDAQSETPTSIQQAATISFNPQVNKGFRKVVASD